MTEQAPTVQYAVKERAINVTGKWIGKQVEVELEGMTVTGELASLHFDQPITRAQHEEGMRVYLHLMGVGGHSWSGTVPGETMITLHAQVER